MEDDDGPQMDASTSLLCMGLCHGHGQLAGVNSIKYPMEVSNDCPAMHASIVLEGASKAEVLFWVSFCLDDA